MMTLAEVIAVGLMSGTVVALKEMAKTFDCEGMRLNVSRGAMVICARGRARRSLARMDAGTYRAPADQAVGMIISVAALWPEAITTGLCRLALGGLASSIELHPPTRRPPAALDQEIKQYWERVLSSAEALTSSEELPDVVMNRTNTLVHEGTELGLRFPRIAYAPRSS